MAHLYELSEQYRALSSLIETEEIGQLDVDAQLATIKSNFEDKAQNIGKLFLSLDADSTTIETEITRLSKRLAATKNRMEWLKSYLLNEMMVAGLDKVKGDVVTVGLRSNPPSVNVLS